MFALRRFKTYLISEKTFAVDQTTIFPAEEELGKKLVKLNQQVERLLQKQKQEIQQDIKQLHLQKESNQKYTNPYESLSIDGVFYDKRK